MPPASALFDTEGVRNQQYSKSRCFFDKMMLLLGNIMQISDIK